MTSRVPYEGRNRPEALSSYRAFYGCIMTTVPSAPPLLAINDLITRPNCANRWHEQQLHASSKLLLKGEYFEDQQFISIYKWKRIKCVSSAVCVWKRMHGDCNNSREMQYKWSVCSPRETCYHFAQLSCYSLFRITLVKQITKPKQTTDDCFSVCLHVDILFCHFLNRRGHRNQTFKGEALFERCWCLLDHQQSRWCAWSVFQLI